MSDKNNIMRCSRMECEASGCHYPDCVDIEKALAKLESVQKENDHLRSAIKDAAACISDWNKKYNELKQSHEKLESEWERLACMDLDSKYVDLNKVRADAVRGAIEDYKNEYVGQGVVALLESYANQLEQGNE